MNRLLLSNPAFEQHGLKRLALAICLVLLGASLAHAQEGVLQIERGFAKITRGAKVRILRELGTPIALTLVDRVQVGTNSKATVWIRDGEETVQLASRSYFSLDNISAEQTTISMPTGKAQFKVTRKLGKLGGKQLGSKAKFQIRTVTAIVAVRGTEFVLGSESGQTSLLTLSGEVAMASAEAPEVEVVVLENQASTVQRGLAPTAPVSVPPEVQKEITQSDSSSSFKAVSFPPAVPIEQARQQKKREEEKKKAEKKEEKKDSKQKAPGKKDSGEQPAEKQEPKKPASGGTTEEKRPAPAPVPKNLPRLDNLPQLPGDLDQILENIQQENNRVRKKVIRLKLKRK